MITTKRCGVKGCPWPGDYPHVPWCLNIEGQTHRADQPTHQHYPKKGMGGKNPDSKIVAILCSYCHDRIDNGDWGNAVVETIQDGKRISTYRAWDLHGETLIERIIETGEADGQGGSRDTGVRVRHRADIHSGAGPERDASNRHGGAGEASDIASPKGSAAEGQILAADEEPLGSGREVGQVAQPSAAEPFDLNRWCAEGMQLVYWGIALRDAKDEVRFRIGDWFNEGDRVLGEETLGYLRGFEDVTVRQYSWVAGRVALDTRVSKLPWTYHRAVAALEPPKQKEWLTKAQDEQMTSKGLYRAIHGQRPEAMGVCPQCGREDKLSEFRRAT